jgi:hypothetical protein
MQIRAQFSSACLTLFKQLSETVGQQAARQAKAADTGPLWCTYDTIEWALGTVGTGQWSLSETSQKP